VKLLLASTTVLLVSADDFIFPQLFLTAAIFVISTILLFLSLSIVLVGLVLSQSETDIARRASSAIP
jgi:hypothetical protein